MDRRGWPVTPEKPGDRFLARSDEILDPALYAEGKKVTLTGTVIGSETRTLGQAPYPYPIFAIGEIRLWSEEESQQRLYPYRYNPYDPGYYSPYGHPYWYPRPHYR